MVKMEIIFEMNNGFDVGFKELTGIPHPKNRGVENLNKVGKISMEIDERIVGFRLVKEGKRRW